MATLIAGLGERFGAGFHVDGYCLRMSDGVRQLQPISQPTAQWIAISLFKRHEPIVNVRGTVISLESLSFGYNTTFLGIFFVQLLKYFFENQLWPLFK